MNDVSRSALAPVRLEPVEVEAVPVQPWHPGAATESGRRLPRAWIPLAVIGAALVLAFMTFLTAATPVILQVTPEDASVRLRTWFALPVGRQVLLLPGVHRMAASAPGHYDWSAEITVRPDVEQQIVPISLQRTPGLVTLELDPDVAATVAVDGGAAAPLDGALELAAGRRSLEVIAERYEPARLRFDVRGMGTAQTQRVTLVPAFGLLEVEVTPADATIYAGETPAGPAPGPVQVDTGRQVLLIQAPGYKPWRGVATLRAGETTRLPPVTLEPADGEIRVLSQPEGANVTLDDRFMGRTPLTLAVDPDVDARIEVYRPGYEIARRTLRVESGETRELRLRLDARLGEVNVRATPADATVVVDGKPVGNASRTLRLNAVPHRIEIRRDGYATYSTDIVPRPELPIDIEVALLTLEEARWAALPEWIESGNGDRLRLFRTGEFSLGAPRRQPGRRRNEVQRDVRFTRAFYLAAREVSNAQFRAFRGTHDSGRFQNQSLNDDELPVVQVSWNDAALYCNWLSQQDGLDPVYEVDRGVVTGFNVAALGYRLPTEAEWAWAARRDADGEPLNFPWGDVAQPPRRAGNFADRSAAYMLPDTLRDYGDGYVATAPSGSFPADPRGLFDLAGNVAEWTNDFYSEDPKLLGGDDPLGPPKDDYHVIRGSSWQHGTIVELRTTFRDFGAKPRADVGFRIARYAEE